MDVCLRSFTRIAATSVHPTAPPDRSRRVSLSGASAEQQIAPDATLSYLTTSRIHASQEKLKSGIKTPKQDIDLIRQRLRRLKEMLT